MKNRRQIREVVLQGLFATQIGEHKAEFVLENNIVNKLDGDKQDRVFAEKLYLRTLKVSEEADTEVENHIDNWEIGRLANVDRIILRMAISEFLHFEDIPPKVTINEAIELAKKFSTAQSGRFVNGILDSVLESLKKAEKVNKSGRGLIDHTPGKSKATS